MLGLVVGWDGNVHEVERRVRVSESNDGDVHEGSLRECLVVKAWVANDHKSGFEVLLGILVSQSTWHPLSATIVSTSVRCKLQNGSLGIWAARDDL